MIDYSLARNRLIGMIQTNENKELYDVGCVGKIHSFNETNDGRYLISLQGISCFRVIKELEHSFNFRLVNSIIINKNENENTFTDQHKAQLLKKYSEYIKFKKINIDLQEIENIETTQIIKFIAMISPFKDIDKQVLLETNNLEEFYNKLLSVIELELVGDLNINIVN